MILYLIPFLSAFIGWITNWVAVKMLFHPRRPLNLGLFTLQGIFPKRQKVFAEKLGRLVAEELIHMDEIRSKLLDPRKLESLYPLIGEHMDHFLQHRMKEKMPVLSLFMGEGLMEKVKEGMMEEIQIMLPRLMDEYSASWTESLPIEEMVRTKVGNFSSDKLEAILHSIMKKEFRFIEFLGGVLGFLIGWIQVLITGLA